MNPSWSSQQVIDKKEQVSLAKDLLVLLSILLGKHLDTSAGMINTILSHMTLITTMIDILESTLTNPEKDWQVL